MMYVIRFEKDGKRKAEVMTSKETMKRRIKARTEEGCTMTSTDKISDTVLIVPGGRIF